MSYVQGLALQAAVYDRLTATQPLTDLVGTAVFDSLPPGALPPLYVVLGAEKVRDASDAGGNGSVHDFTISIVTTQAGFSNAKQAAAAVSAALLQTPLALDRGRVLGLRFHAASAVRVGTAETRRIDLTFRARLSDD